jgi:lipid II:glycine glycyltransferase (peptidoglycan interpeptide bridge formation enzyme)
MARIAGNRRSVRALPGGYAAEVDSLDERGWTLLLDRFADANIYQTWAHGEVRAGARNVSRLVLKRNGQAVAAAQVRLVRVPLLGSGIAYVRWGPLIRRNGDSLDLDVMRLAARALRNEFACRRGLVLRMNPAVFEEDASELASILADEGFGGTPNATPEHTIVIDLTRSPEELRAGIRKEWRRQLRIAESHGLTIVDGTSDALFGDFVAIYGEMVRRKGFPEPNDIMEFRAIQQGLPDQHRMRVMLCRAGDTTHAGLICSALGDTAVYLFGATSDAGMETRGSYLLQWRLMEWLKAEDVTRYDLHGVNAERNPGVYRFKSDLCGTANGRHVRFVGRFDCPGSALSSSSVRAGETARALARRVRRMTLTPRSVHLHAKATVAADPPS